MLLLTLPQNDLWLIGFGALFLIISGLNVIRDLRIKTRNGGRYNDTLRIQELKRGFFTMWGLTLLGLAAWFLSGRDVTILKFGTGWGAVAIWVTTLLGSLYLIYGYKQCVRCADARATVARQMNEAGDFDLLRPESPLSYTWAQAVAISAGPTEEFLTRAVLITLIGLWFPLWGAALLAGVIFVGLHAYQGPKGMLRTIPMTIVLTIMFIASGTILPGILLHSIVDMAGIGMFWQVQRYQNEIACA